MRSANVNFGMLVGVTLFLSGCNAQVTVVDPSAASASPTATATPADTPTLDCTPKTGELAA